MNSTNAANTTNTPRAVTRVAIVVVAVAFVDSDSFCLRVPGLIRQSGNHVAAVAVAVALLVVTATVAAAEDTYQRRRKHNYLCLGFTQMSGHSKTPDMLLAAQIVRFGFCSFCY